jgi:hypothetical protein
MPEHAALIAVLLVDRPMCRDCICLKSGLDAVTVDRYLAVIGSKLRLRRQDDERCRVCGEPTTAFSLSMPLA